MYRNLAFGTPIGFLLTAIAIVLCLTIGGCKESVTDASASSILDPSIKPVVIYTYPAGGTVGPFPGLFAPGANEYRPSMYVQFNKLMVARDFVPPCYLCLGFARPVKFRGTSGAPSTILYFNIYETDTYRRSRYEIGRSYSFSLDSNFQDVNGNRLSQTYTFTFEPEPFFRVTSTEPVDRDTFQYSNAPFRVDFNSPVDANILNFVHISPDVAGQWELKYDSLGIIFRPSISYHSSTEYTIVLDPGAGDREHHVLNAPFTTHARTKAMQVLSAYVYPYFSYLNGSSMASLVSINFTYPCDSLSVLPAIAITPTVPLTLVNGTLPKFFATNDFAPLTNYYVTISTSLRSFDGAQLSSPYTFSFRTDSFRLLLGTSDIYGRIEMFFSGRVTMSSLQSSFSITPHLDGTFSSDDNPATLWNSPEYWFTPSTPLQSGVQYTIRLDTTLSSIAGYHLAQPASFHVP